MSYVRRVQAIFAVLFLAASMSAQAQPAAAPPQPVAAASAAESKSYVMGPGDKVRITVFGEESMTGEYSVTAAGNISFPLIGNVQAAGRSMEIVGEEIRSRLSQGYLNDPRVAIELQAYRTFFILGEVNKPGAYPYTAGLTLAQAVATAGGYTYRAKKSKVILRQADGTEDKSLSVKQPGSVAIGPGDTVTIPERFF